MVYIFVESICMFVRQRMPIATEACIHLYFHTYVNLAICLLSFIDNTISKMQRKFFYLQMTNVICIEITMNESTNFEIFDLILQIFMHSCWKFSLCCLRVWYVLLSLIEMRTRTCDLFHAIRFHFCHHHGLRPVFAIE